MSYRHPVEKRLDAVIGRRMLNGCWFISSIGIAILQMRLIAQTWNQSHQALFAALVISAWLLGSLLSATLLLGSRRSQSNVLSWGVGLLICAAFWLLLPLNHALEIAQPMAISELGLMGFLFGLISTAWLGQRRPWPSVSERVVLAKNTLATMLGLGVIWLLPAWSGAVEITCLAPLLALDCWPEARCPLQAPGRLLDNWYDTNEGADRWRVRLTNGRMFGMWWWSYLAQRGQLSIILLASGISIILGSVWSAVPTPFASDLLAAHQVQTLGWLIGGQLLALMIGLGCFLAFRGILGAPDRLIPQEQRVQVWAIALLMPFLMAGGLAALGLPLLQVPWWLTFSLGIYTLAGVLWGILLPRLRPSVSTMVFTQRHLLRGPRTGQLDKGQLAYERAQEEYANRVIMILECLLTAALAPVVGWLVDRWSVDGLLLIAGGTLLAFLVLSVTLIGLRHRMRYKRIQTDHYAAEPTQAFSWQQPQSTPIRTSGLLEEPQRPLSEELELVEEVQIFLKQRYYEQ